MIPLPQDFVKRMQEMLGEDASAFFASYEVDRSYGLRYNPLKITEEDFLKQMPFALEKISWAKEGYFYIPEERPGRHPLHEAGAYYIQEPSAMAVAEALDVKPGDTVCDLCAAPGGKTTQLAGKMQGEGLIIANEYVSARAKILAQNVERMGIRNTVVLNETPQNLSRRFPAFFDKILVDAPCSGEGMFRKDEESRTQWSPEQVQVCADRQDEIMEEADRMLKPGGILVYSTCTFAPLENEGTISRFLKTHPDYEAEQIPFCAGEWETTVRLFPHKIRGEGHFIARLRKKAEHKSRTEECITKKKVNKAADRTPGINNSSYSFSNRKRKKFSSFTADTSEFEKFASQVLLDWKVQGSIQKFGSHLYLVPEQMPDMSGISVVRPGLELGENKKNRFEPAHALAMALRPSQVRASLELEACAEHYLHGEAIQGNVKNGWVLMCIDGVSVGWGKAVNGQIKNHYPKGLRR